jgi:hypothetical protein
MMEKFHRIFTSNGWITLNNGKGKKMTEIEKAIYLLADALALPDPHPSLIYAARYLITEYDRRALPDWVEALANGNLYNWVSVIDEVRRLKAAEEMEANE